MVGIIQRTNNFNKEKKTIKKNKKMSKGNDAVVNAHGVRMKWVVVSGMTDGSTRGSSPIEQPNEFKSK